MGWETTPPCCGLVEGKALVLEFRGNSSTGEARARPFVSGIDLCSVGRVRAVVQCAGRHLERLQNAAMVICDVRFDGE